MFIKDMFSRIKPTISFEIFPPKKDYPVETIYDTIESLKDLRPDFVSVTYSAGGSGSVHKTLEIASIVKNKYHIEALAHLTCITSTQQKIHDTLYELKENNIENILALRGDLPSDPDFNPDDLHHYKHARDLISDLNINREFCVGGACYPEGHIECSSFEEDLLHLKDKVALGVDFLITQLFFDNEIFYRYRDNLDRLNINIPVLAGIMPVLNKKQIERIVSLSGCTIPKKFTRIMERYEYNPDALRQAGIAYATEQIIDLLSSHIDGIHIYTMNRPEPTREIINNISTIRDVLLSAEKKSQG